MRETQIKHALTHHLKGAASAPRLLFLEEVGINGGEIRADLVQVTDMHCYEIKSSGDSLTRLIYQGSRYSRAFDRITLVTAECHLKKALSMLPSWWGIIVIPAQPEKSFKQVRKAKQHKYHQPEVVASLLKREEALMILTELGISRGYRSKSLYVIQTKVAELLPLKELKLKVRECLIERTQQLF